MASISSLGVGSNLDLGSLLSQMQALENQPLAALQQRQVGYTAKLSAYGQLQGLLVNLQSAANKLTDAKFFSTFKATSSATDVAGASAGSSAAAGSYAVNVTQLAKAQSLVSGGVASTTAAIGGGAASTVTFDFGSISGTLNAAGTYNAGAAFTVDAARTAVSLTIDSSNNTLAGIRDAINAKSGLGVSASIVNDGSTNRLVLTSTTTGQKSSARITVSGDAAVQALLANDPAGTQNLKETASAGDAALTVNGIVVTSASNTVTGAIQDVSLTLGKIGTSTVTVAADTAAMTAGVSDFVNAYNSLKNKISDLTRFDTAKKSGAVLMGDWVARAIDTRVRAVLIKPQTGAATAPKVLSDIGVAFQKDGTLALDSAKLGKALAAGASGVASLFANSAGTSGVAREIGTLVTSFTDPGGLIKGATDGMTTSLRQLDRDYENMQGRIDAKMAHYRTQFQQLDQLMSGMNSMSSYLSQQFSALGGSKGK